VINIAALSTFFIELNSRYNPATEFVAQGNCIVGTWDRPVQGYMQGGSGYLLSRYACEILSRLAEKFMLFGSGDEDRDFGDFLRERLNVTGSEMTSDRFLGYTLDSELRASLISKRYEEIPVCRSVLSEGNPGCRRFVARIRDVVFLHQHLEFSEYVIGLGKAMFDAPPWIAWWMVNYFPQICRTENHSLSV